MGQSSDSVRLFLIKIDDDFHYESQSGEAARQLTKSLCATGQKASVLTTMVPKDELKAWLAGKRKQWKIKPIPTKPVKSG